ncbi:MAG: FHIPEP family type III secretion protein, partial [Planctomycetota bacterium]
LVSQLPALLISVAAGIVITRSSIRSDLGGDMLRQLFAKPQPLILAGTFLLVLALARFPTVPLVIVGGGLFALALYPVATTETPAQPEPRESSRPARTREKRKAEPDPSQSLAVDPLGIEVGMSLVRLADPHRAGTMLKAIGELRHRVAREMGVLLPKVRIRDNLSLDETTYRLMMFDAEVGRGTCPRRQVFELSAEPGNRTPSDAPSGRWIPAEEQSQSRARGMQVLSPSEYMVEHLRQVVVRRAAELMTRDATHRLMEQARPVAGIAMEELVPHRMSLGDVQKVLQALLAEGLSIRNLPLIIEALCDESCVDNDVPRLARAVRQRLLHLAGDRHLSHA